MATIRRRGDKVWEVRVFAGRDASGKPKQVSKTVRGSKRDAEREAAKLTLAPQRQPGSHSVSELLDEWIEVKAAGWAAYTLREYRSRANRIKLDPIGSKKVAALKVSDIDRWVARLRENGVGESAIRNRHSVLRAALQQAVRWEWIGVNPASNAPIKRPERIQRSAMTDADVRAVLEAASEVNEWCHLAMRLAAETGARRSELAALRWDALVGDRLIVDRQVIVAKGDDGITRKRVEATKTGSRRAVSLSSSTLELVQSMAGEWAEVTTWMFGPDAEPPHPDRIGWWWKRVREASGIDSKWRLHDLRHWSATSAIANGADVRTVANRLGHADPSMTLRVYAHAVESADVALAARLGQVLDG
jgi:integrase